MTRPYLHLDAFLIMPNHFHAILVIHREEPHRTAEGTARRAPTEFGKPVSRSLPTIIRAFKSAVASCINQLYGTGGQQIWQRNYYEHIIRSDASLDQVRRYTGNNPLQWELDSENPVRRS